jgi:hypothetical protein
MIFYRSPASAGAAAGPSIRTIRTLTAVALTAYPAGAITYAFAPDGLPAFIIGFGLILVSLVAATPVLGSRLQRIVADESKQLDEMEMHLRQRALSWSYSVLSAALLLMVMYGAIAEDVGGWTPDSYEHWNGIFWGAFLYVTLLPATRLAWTMDAAEDADDD